DEAPHDPGYIKAYPPGVREHGGQYTHAAIWVMLALIRLGRNDDAWRCFNLLNPINHARDSEMAEHYRVEPYVVAADVYGAGALTGRGGWTWYTGSAGWLYRAAVEGILGLRKEGDRLILRPSLPSEWPGFTLEVELDELVCEVVVERSGNGEVVATVNGKETDNEGAIALETLRSLNLPESVES